VRPYSPDSPWDFDPSITFLNHGSYGACPRPVLEAQRALIAYLESDPVRFLSREYEARLDAARESVAAFLGALIRHGPSADGSRGASAIVAG